MQDGQKAVWSIPYVSVAFFPSLKQNFIAYRSSKVSSHPDCIFEIDRLWQSGFRRVSSNCCSSCSFEPEIIKKFDLSSHKKYSNNILNFQESMTILNACTKKSQNLLKAPHIFYISITRWETISVAGWWDKVSTIQQKGIKRHILTIQRTETYRECICCSKNRNKRGWNGLWIDIWLRGIWRTPAPNPRETINNCLPIGPCDNTLQPQMTT